MGELVRGCRLALMVLIVAAISGCCSMRAHWTAPVRDHLQAYVLVGIGERPKCPLPECSAPARNVKVGEELSVWLRAVYKDRLLQPITNLRISLEVVDPWGDVASAVDISPTVVTTGPDGFNPQTITVKATKAIGGFVVRATYPDRHVTSVSLSRQVVVDFP